MRFNLLMAHAHRIMPRLVESALQIAVTNAAKDEAFSRTYWKIVRENTSYLYFREAYNVYQYLRSVLPLEGSLAEAGVFKGGTAKLICEFKGDRPLHLFDTFEGMPEVRPDIDTYIKDAFSSTSAEAVSHYLSAYPQVHIHKGFFPATTAQLPNDITFSFVHLDMDIYESTLEGLKYFWPRMVKGGIIMSHDYNTHYYRGVKKAFDEYFDGQGVMVQPLWDTHCMVRKD